MVSLEMLRQVVGAPEHWTAAYDIAERAVTLLRDRDALLPLSSARAIAVVTYAPELEATAGRRFAIELRTAIPGARVHRISPRSSRGELDSLARVVAGAERVIVTTHVRTIEGEGRFAIPPEIAAWIDSLARAERVVVVANGNPYVIQQFPAVGTYLVTYGIGEALERAAARAVAGLAPITGKAPISLPGFFQRGDGLVRHGVTVGGGTQ
jgi:beta-N-acetylhexosaminidase